MKNNKLSPIEELRAERLRLKIELNSHEENIKHNLNYIKHNWGSLLLSSIFSTSSGSEKSSKDYVYTDSSKSYNNLSSLYSKASSVAPMIWDIAQPILIGLMTKKISSFFFSKKKDTQGTNRKKGFFSRLWK